MHSTSVSLQVTILSFFICIYYVVYQSAYSVVLNFNNIIILFVAEQLCAF